ncbi:DUF3618 domain-containing protein [Agrococcus sediminis]|jgi:hypothetical protein|uniref:DUF3618 domain-containing protein n=1 Tax=Agrococcus sediminis TaxID=2599924 RepID=A0A5M8QMH5_9MICO|nr:MULTISPECIES: DUF3618 domain-containing protein [Agrococcus]KAA6436180.1 DUF3618 domain-containing protein [Agrococcus sediminis]MDR7233896.1 hypothetical protein [Agrococcus sp. BE272]RWR22324.1 DUF3618 domain-containing protein [Agrococcus lahaulensis]UOW01636.1 DUF3618 domain-containing protein [Agrococcus sp. SCSIO52902]
MTEQRDIDRQREEVRRHLDELESRLNPKKVANRLIGKAQDSYNDDPTPWMAAAAGVAVLVVGGIALAIFGRR